MLFLVRHGRPQIVAGVPAAEWELDPAAYDDVWALRSSGRLPDRAACFTAPERSGEWVEGPGSRPASPCWEALATPDLIAVEA